MADLLRKVTVEQGHDPRDFVVFAYGGAGPTHAYAYTEAAGISTLVVPPTSTVHSAYGTVTSDRYRAVQATEVQRSTPGSDQPAAEFEVARIREVFADLRQRCHADLDDDPRATFKRIAYFRFTRQAHELQLVLPPGEITLATVEYLIAEFFSAYERLYGAGTTAPGVGLEMHTLRVEGRVRVTDLRRAEARDEGGDIATTQIGTRLVHFPETGQLDTPVYRGEGLARGTRLVGPAVLEMVGTTVVVGPNQRLRVDELRNLIIDCDGELS
jgi:N-methylhydantoinase A